MTAWTLKTDDVCVPGERVRVVQSLCPADQLIVGDEQLGLRVLLRLMEESAAPHRTGGSVPG